MRQADLAMARNARYSDPTRKHEPRRFPYWKIQYFVETNLSWKDKQTAFLDKEESEVEARALGKNRVRLMEVNSPNSRKPLPEL